jgi:hypothetical protein
MYLSYDISPNVISLPSLSLSIVASYIPHFQQLNSIRFVVLHHCNDMLE